MSLSLVVQYMHMKDKWSGNLFLNIYFELFSKMWKILYSTLCFILFQSMENGLNPIAVQFAMQLVKLYLVDERQSGIVTEVSICFLYESWIYRLLWRNYLTLFSDYYTFTDQWALDQNLNLKTHYWRLNFSSLLHSSNYSYKIIL